MGDSKPSGRRIKVVRLLEEYDLDGVGPELERRWTADADERMSLRDLADFFNQQLLETSLARAGMQPLPGEVENTYRLLTDDDVTGADRTRARRRLEREGIDVDRLDRDFVTYQAIRSYLKEYRGARYDHDDDRPRREVEGENMQRIRGRTLSVTEGKLKTLVRGENLTLGEFRVFVDINVLCEDCGSGYEIGELLERGGCDCEPKGEASEG